MDNLRRRRTDHHIPLDPDLVQVLDTRRAAEAGHRRRLYAFVLLALAFIVVAGVLWDALHRIEREALLRTYQLCVQSNEDRAISRGFIRQLVQFDGVVTEGEEFFLELAENDYADRPCPPEPE